ncbi:MAG: hypothetical protein IIA72_10480 [Proteobacteria bacterium]|nr:hypothetical protein [Pseudomonadota bacterium]
MKTLDVTAPYDGALLGEGTLALLSLIACSAGFANAEAWANHYQDWNVANTGGSKIGAFVNGCANLLEHLHVSPELSLTFVGMLVIAFSATTLDTATRIQRYIIAELGAVIGVNALKNRFLAGAIAAGTPILLLLGANWKKLWPIFGAANQMLAALSLLVLSAYLARQRVPKKPVLFPMIFLVIMTGWGLLIQLKGFWTEKNWLLVGVTGALMALSLWIIIEGISVIRNAEKMEPLTLR